MSIVLKLRMLNGENEKFVRDYEVSYDSTLLDFHNFICGDLGYDPGSMSSFFTADDNWEKLDEFTLIDMGRASEDDDLPLAMENVKMGQILRHNNDRLLYVFDPFGDRCMFLELMGAGKGGDMSGYPKVMLSEGNPPAQFDPSVSSECDSIFDEAMDGFFDFGGDENSEDDFF